MDYNEVIKIYFIFLCLYILSYRLISTLFYKKKSKKKILNFLINALDEYILQLSLYKISYDK